MADYITKIRTVSGDKQIDYNALANLPDLSLVGEVKILDSADNVAGIIDTPVLSVERVDGGTKVIATDNNGTTTSMLYDGVSTTLTSSGVTYSVGSSGTNPPSDGWQGIVPEVPQGKYLWSRAILRFNTGSSITFYSVARWGVDGTGTVSMVCDNSPDETGNVTITADDVGALPSTGGTMTGAIAMGGKKITELGTPTASKDAATKAYVDGVNAVPSCTASDNGKFLRVVSGVAAWQTVQSAEEVSV